MCHVQDNGRVSSRTQTHLRPAVDGGLVDDAVARPDVPGQHSAIWTIKSSAHNAPRHAEEAEPTIVHDEPLLERPCLPLLEREVLARGLYLHVNGFHARQAETSVTQRHLEVREKSQKEQRRDYEQQRGCANAQRAAEAKRIIEQTIRRRGSRGSGVRAALPASRVSANTRRGAAQTTGSDVRREVEQTRGKCTVAQTTIFYGPRA